MNVSIYKNITDTIGVSGQLISFLTTDKWQNLSIQVRNETYKEMRNQLKRRLPCCTPSGLFKRRNKAYLIKHSGYICVDIDEEDNPSINDWQGFITELGHLKETVFAGLSVSGEAHSLIQIRTQNITNSILKPWRKIIYVMDNNRPRLKMCHG